MTTLGKASAAEQMRALVIGQGGREHALVKALKNSSSISEVHALPGSDGIAQDAKMHNVNWQDFPAVISLVREHKIDFVMVGPENPLVEGLTDALRAEGIACVGPSKEAAMLEGSKIFCKDFFIEAGIPTARSFVVNSVASTLEAAKAFKPPYVLKADGLAAGKGVFIAKTLEQLERDAHSIFVAKSLGAAGERALLEEFSPGYEVSYLVLTNGETFEPLPLAQDHKRLLDNDEGPNTGGMGVVAPVAMDEKLRARIDSEVIKPTMALFKKRGFTYRGVLFVGLMITEKGPSVLEFNTRFGDPETQAILPLLNGDWGSVLHDLSQGHLQKLNWSTDSTCCVVLAAEGYPDSPVKGVAISGAQSLSETSYLIHAGTKRSGDTWTTNGGRVLNAMGVGANLKEAIARAYEQAERVQWKGRQMRKDIGSKQ